MSRQDDSCAAQHATDTRLKNCKLVTRLDDRPAHVLVRHIFGFE